MILMFDEYVETEHEDEYVIELANEVRKHLDLTKEVKALLNPVVSPVSIKPQSQAHVSTLQRVFASWEISKVIEPANTLMNKFYGCDSYGSTSIFLSHFSFQKFEFRIQTFRYFYSCRQWAFVTPWYLILRITRIFCLIITKPKYMPIFFRTR